MSRGRAYRILILGGYGHFGMRIAHALAARTDCHLIVAGRDIGRARAAVTRLQRADGASYEAAAVDATDPQLAQALRAHGADLLIHTAGPFQSQSYHVARACIEAGTHYVDLADGREFVAGISRLDEEACRANVLVVSGASTVPALSAAVVDHYRGRFADMTEVDIGITPGNRTPRGLSTVESVLSYCGKAFTRWEQGEWRRVYGWQDLHAVLYPKLGKRWFANCDVPDLCLFPPRYAIRGSVKFHAGLELPVIQFGLWLMSWMSRWNWVSNWVPAARFLKRASEWLLPFGTDAGGMHIAIRGHDADGRSRSVLWLLTALEGDGPQIPCIAAIVLARKLADGRTMAVGARPCLDLLTLAEFDEAVRGLAISWEESWSEAQ